MRRVRKLVGVVMSRNRKLLPIDRKLAVVIKRVHAAIAIHLNMASKDVSDLTCSVRHKLTVCDRTKEINRPSPRLLDLPCVKITFEFRVQVTVRCSVGFLLCPERKSTGSGLIWRRIKVLVHWILLRESVSIRKLVYMIGKKFTIASICWYRRRWNGCGSFRLTVGL